MKNIKQIKTTILGVVFLIIGGWYLFENQEAPNMIILGGCAAISIGLILAPDTIIDKIKNLTIK